MANQRIGIYSKAPLKWTERFVWYFIKSIYYLNVAPLE
jgi:hypothetical protein